MSSAMAAHKAARAARLGDGEDLPAAWGRAFEAAFEQPRDVMDEKTKAAVTGPIGARL